MRRCRVGMIGAGNVAGRHARVLTGFDDVELVGVTDVVPEAAAALAGTHGARTFPDVGSLLEAGLDAVYVCVPPFAHGPVEDEVLAGGLPMFVEKPVAADRPTAEHIGALVAERGTLTAVGHHWRYLEVVRRARELLADRPVHLVAGAWLDKIPPVAWWRRRERSGGPVVEQAAHVLDLARVFAGEVTEVSAVAATSTRQDTDIDTDIDVATAATLRFAGGAVGSLTTTCVLDWKHRAGIEVYAEGFALALTEETLLVREGDREHRFTGDPTAAHVAVDRAFVDAVRGAGDDVRVPYAEALRTHRVGCAVAASAASGQPVGVSAE